MTYYGFEGQRAGYSVLTKFVLIFEGRGIELVMGLHSRICLNDLWQSKEIEI